MADKSTWRNAGPDGDLVIQCTGHTSSFVTKDLK